VLQKSWVWSLKVDLGLSYLKDGKVYLLNDNEDVDRFMGYINVSRDISTLYVVGLKSSEIGSGTGSNQLSSSTPIYGDHNVQQCTYQHQNFMIPPQLHQQFFVPPHFQTNRTLCSIQPLPYLQQSPPFFLDNLNLNQALDPN